MVWNSVVGKLWITIIGLVAVVLTVLSLLLVQFLDGYYFEQRSDNLKQLALQLSRIIQTSPDGEHIETARELLEAYNTSLIVTGVKYNPKLDHQSRLPVVDPNLLIDDPKLSRAAKGELGVVRGRFPVTFPGSSVTNGQMDILAVAVPLVINNVPDGSIILYQNLQDLADTTKETTKYILYAAAIGIFLATIFAFFLVTRITHPLRQMKKAANALSQGDFTAKIVYRSNDEIGDLGATFNRMAKQLDELIHALSREKEQLFSVLRSMVDGVITVDKEGRIILTNPPAEDMLRALLYEHSPNEWEKNKKSLQGMKLPEPFVDFSYKVMSDRHESVTDISAQGRVWSVVMAPLYDRDQVGGAVAVLRDMTKERQMDKLRKDFIANVSHELRTPLAMLQGYSEAIVDDIAGDPEETKELASIIYDESVRMSRLVNDLLDLGRMEAGFVELNKAPIHLLPFMDRIIRKFSVVGKERNIAVLADTDGLKHDLYMLDIDRMEQVFTNLIDNALRHTKEGGKVILKAASNNDSLTLEIRDTGSGIPEEDLPFVFERFYKADKARTRSTSGTGIGLAIVRQIVHSHGGQITVRSKLGEGTSFIILLPLRDLEEI